MTIDNFVIDPPYPQQKGGIRNVTPNQTRYIGYQTLPIADIFNLLDSQIFPQASPNHNVFLWGIDKFLTIAEQEMINRNYKLHARLIWDKGNGVAPAFTIRYSHEYVSWFYKYKLQPISKDQRGKIRTVFKEKPREHSRKPDCLYNMIEALYPVQTKMDVFSREKRTNWEQFGDEINYFSNI